MRNLHASDPASLIGAASAGRRLARTRWTGTALLLGVVASVLVVGSTTQAHASVIDARCKNAKTDAATLQNAIDASSAGSRIVFHGPCLLTATVVLAGDRSYSGDSASTTVTAAPHTNLPALLASDSWAENWTSTGTPITLTNLTLDARSNLNSKSGAALIIRSWDTTISRLHIANAKTDGLLLTNLSRDGTPLSGGNTQVNGTMTNLFVTDSGKDGIHVQDTGNAVTDWNLFDSWVAGSGDDAIRVENGAGWVIERNHVYGVGDAAISVDRLFATSISDNYVEDFNTNGIEATVQGEAASTISNNRIFNFFGTGTVFLSISQVNYGVGNVAVESNVIRGSGKGTGLSYRAGDHPLTVVSTGNLVTDVTTPLATGNGVSVSRGY